MISNCKAFFFVSIVFTRIKDDHSDYCNYDGRNEQRASNRDQAGSDKACNAYHHNKQNTVDNRHHCVVFHLFFLSLNTAMCSSDFFFQPRSVWGVSL